MTDSLKAHPFKFKLKPTVVSIASAVLAENLWFQEMKWSRFLIGTAIWGELPSLKDLDFIIFL